MGFSLHWIRLDYKGKRMYLFVSAIVVLALALTELAEIVELPFESLFGSAFVSSSLISAQFVVSSMTTFGYGGLFALMFLESASLPIPSEVVLPFAGYLVFTGNMSFEGVLLVGTLAGLSGALADYYLALKLGRPAIQRIFRWAGVGQERLAKAELWLDKKGSWSILISRFIPGLRSIISLPTGALEMKLSAFSVMTVVGAFGWTALLVYLGYSAGGLWLTAFAHSAPVLTEAGLIAVTLASTAYIVYYVYSELRYGSHTR